MLKVPIFAYVLLGLSRLVVSQNWEPCIRATLEDIAPSTKFRVDSVIGIECSFECTATRSIARFFNVLSQFSDDSGWENLVGNPLDAFYCPTTVELTHYTDDSEPETAELSFFYSENWIDADEIIVNCDCIFGSEPASTPRPSPRPTARPTSAPVTPPTSDAAEEAGTAEHQTVDLDPTSLLWICQSDCDNDSDCWPGLICHERQVGDPDAPGCLGDPFSGYDYCVFPEHQFVASEPASLLGLCQGDCDSDSDCAEGLVCYDRVRGEPGAPGCRGFPSGEWDYCAFPEHQFVASEPVSLLGLCQGDCDSDSDCAEGLVCFDRSTSSDPGAPGCLGEPVDNWDYCVLPEHAVSGTMAPTFAGAMASTFVGTADGTYDPKIESTFLESMVTETMDPTLEDSLEDSFEGIAFSRAYEEPPTKDPTHD